MENFAYEHKNKPFISSIGTRQRCAWTIERGPNFLKIEQKWHNKPNQGQPTVTRTVIRATSSVPAAVKQWRVTRTAGNRSGRCICLDTENPTGHDFATNLAFLVKILENIKHAICFCCRHAVAGSTSEIGKAPN